MVNASRDGEDRTRVGWDFTYRKGLELGGEEVGGVHPRGSRDSLVWCLAVENLRSVVTLVRHKHRAPRDTPRLL